MPEEAAVSVEACAAAGPVLAHGAALRGHDVRCHGARQVQPAAAVRLVHQVGAEHVPRAAEGVGELRPVLEHARLRPLRVVPQAVPVAGPLGVDGLLAGQVVVERADPVAREQHEDAVLSARLVRLEVAAPERFAHAGCADGEGGGLYVLGGVNARDDLMDLLHLRWGGI